MNGSLLLTAFVVVLPLWTFAQQGCILGNCRQGYGTFIFEDGSRYTGEFQDGYIHGLGIFEAPDGEKYTGNWIRQKRWGKGRRLYANGDLYVGDFKEDKIFGFGEMWFHDGGYYRGKWEDNLPHGEGIFVSATGSVAKGDWKAGKQITSTNSGETALEGGTNPTTIYAVVIGVADYQSMPALQFADDDALQIGAFLRSASGGALGAHQLTILTDAEATAQRIEAVTAEAFAKADDNDMILFYFSGHGVEGAFLPVDADGYQNMLSHTTLKSLMLSSRAKYKLVIADACHAGGMLPYRDQGDQQAFIKKFYGSFEGVTGGMALLMSSKGTEISLEDGRLRSGVFSFFLVEGLRGAADTDHNTIVNIAELSNFVCSSVAKHTNRIQNPVILGKFDPLMPVGIVRW
jgi:hypothetical protein